MTIRFIPAFIAAIVLGVFLTNPWVFSYYLLLMIVATIVVLFFVIYSLVHKMHSWKFWVLFLAVGYTAALTSYSIQSYRRSRLITIRNHFIAALYNYRNKNGRFPKAITEASIDISSLRGNYVPDTTLQNFTLYTKDVFGMPWVFKSKDGTWGR